MTAFFARVAVFFVLLATIPRRTRTPDTVAYFKPWKCFWRAPHTTWGDFRLSLQKTEEKIWQYLKS